MSWHPHLGQIFRDTATGLQFTVVGLDGPDIYARLCEDGEDDRIIGLFNLARDALQPLDCYSLDDQRLLALG